VGREAAAAAQLEDGLEFLKEAEQLGQHCQDLTSEICSTL